jgi:serine/threonine protein kinase/Tol biopolymer transport system component
MSLTPGTRIGAYEVVESLGSGGMGEVYRAHDAKLRRDVAVKILPDRHRLDSDRQTRFEREALALAALNHPNIATVYGVEHSDGAQALVMELVDGPTLAERIDRQAGPTPVSSRERTAHNITAPGSAAGLPIGETLAIARQMVDALEAAHERNVIHRDLKPANIKIRPDGVVKILDFGLAKALDAGLDAPDGGAATVTLTSALTIVGTPPYMSPEQARGQQVDQRTDIWAFGCVLYEMLTGRRAFEGPTGSDTLAAVLDREPDYERLPQETPLLVRRLVKHCLNKDPRRRLRDIADARQDLDDAPQLGTSGTAVLLPPHGRRVSRPLLATGLVALAAAALAAILAITFWPRSEPEPRSIHTTVLLPPGVTVTRGPGRLMSLALSPDGHTLVVAASDGSTERLYVRSLDRPEATPLEGTEGAATPFFSPDGAWVGFFAERRLKRVPVGGGAAVDIASGPGFPAGASWGADDRIVFAGYQTPLQMVDARGGTPENVIPTDRNDASTALASAQTSHLFPEMLPGGRILLFTEGTWTHAFDLVSKQLTPRVIEGVGARYSPNGYLLVTRGSTLLAAPFDAAKLEVRGPVAPVAQGVDLERTTTGAAYLAVSPSGTVAFVPSAQRFALVLVNADGGERVITEEAMLQNPRFSPDGNRLVVAATRGDRARTDLWIHDLNGATPPSRLTSDGGRAPVWSSDGASVTYSQNIRDRGGIYRIPADGRGNAERIIGIPTFHWLVGWTPTQTLVYGQMEQTPGDQAPASSIAAFEAGESRRVVGPGRTWGGRLSRDGRWLAYYSQDSGYFEIYATPFPDTGPKSLIAEGTDPAWSPDGTAIYYRSGSRLMAARVETSSTVRVLSHRLVVEPFIPPLYDDYDIHPNGKTLALVRPAGELRGREIALLINWPAQLERLKSQ